MLLHRVLDAAPLTSLQQYLDIGGGEGVRRALELGPAAVIDCVLEAGLRGRGGAGFPTGAKWATVATNSSESIPATVVVNGAEGEPGSFKDRTLLRTNPYRVLEGALIAADAVGADRVVVALKESFTRERELVEAAIDEIREAGWAERLRIDVLGGPSHYLFGEETALLEVLDGREPFPRVAPPYRQGATDVGTDPGEAAGTTLAGPGELTATPPALVDNVETLANLADLVANGAAWFRELGTEGTPGTFVCTVTGDVSTHGVAEFAAGTPLVEVLNTIGGGPVDGGSWQAALSGVANPFLLADRFGVGLDYEAFAAVGSGLGAAGFIVLGAESDPLAVAAGVSRFLSVESCGQCQPCKQDGLEITERLVHLSGGAGTGTADDLTTLHARVATVADGARCYLGFQHQRVIASLLASWPERLDAQVSGEAPPVEPVLIAPIQDIVDGRAILDEDQAGKQPDWTMADHWGGQSPADARDQRASA